MIYRYVQKSLSEIEIYIRDYCHSDTIKEIRGITSLNKGCPKQHKCHVLHVIGSVLLNKGQASESNVYGRGNPL